MTTLARFPSSETTERVTRCIDLGGAVGCVHLALAKLATADGKTAEWLSEWKPTEPKFRVAADLLRAAGKALLDLIDAQLIDGYRETVESCQLSVRFERNVNGVIVAVREGEE